MYKVDSGARFCVNEEKLKNLYLKYEDVSKQLHEQAKLVIKLKPFMDLATAKGSNIDVYKMELRENSVFVKFLSLKFQKDNLKERIEDESSKLSKEEFDDVSKMATCSHLFIDNDNNKKICLKCSYIKDGFNMNNKKDIMKKYLYTLNRNGFKTKETISEIVLPEIIKDEKLEFFQVVTNYILERYPNINNIELSNKIIEYVARINIMQIENIYDIDNMDNNIAKSYNEYKKLILKK